MPPNNSMAPSFPPLKYPHKTLFTVSFATQMLSNRQPPQKAPPPHLITNTATPSTKALPWDSFSLWSKDKLIGSDWSNHFLVYQLSNQNCTYQLLVYCLDFANFTSLKYQSAPTFPSYRVFHNTCQPPKMTKSQNPEKFES